MVVCKQQGVCICERWQVGDTQWLRWMRGGGGEGGEPLGPSFLPGSAPAY